MYINILRQKSPKITVSAIVKASGSDKLESGEIIVGKEIHTGTKIIKVGLIKWLDGEHNEEESFRQTCRRILKFAQDSNLSELAFDIDSISLYMGEKSYTFNILVEEISAYKEFALNVWLIISDDIEYYKISQELNKYLDGLSQDDNNYSFCDEDDPIRDEFKEYQNSLKNEKPFREYLLDLIDARGYRKFSEVYKPSGVSKATFSKIINWNINPPHKPSKETVAALAIGLNLSITEAQEFYNKAGYHLTKTEMVDIVVRFFIERDKNSPKYRHGKIDEVNYCLEYLGLPPLGERPRESCKINIKKMEV